MSRFRGALKIIGNCFATNSKLSDVKKKEIHASEILNISLLTNAYHPSQNITDDEFLKSKKSILGGTLQKAIRFLKDTIDSAD